MSELSHGRSRASRVGPVSKASPRRPSTRRVLGSSKLLEMAFSSMGMFLGGGMIDQRVSVAPLGRNVAPGIRISFVTVFRDSGHLACAFGSRISPATELHAQHP
jgi:hypothetical protein